MNFYAGKRERNKSQLTFINTSIETPDEDLASRGRIIGVRHIVSHNGEGDYETAQAPFRTVSSNARADLRILLRQTCVICT